jgi:hypothetical protein
MIASAAADNLGIVAMLSDVMTGIVRSTMIDRC